MLGAGLDEGSDENIPALGLALIETGEDFYQANSSTFAL